MSDTSNPGGVEFTPQENAYFESSGATPAEPANSETEVEQQPTPETEQHQPEVDDPKRPKFVPHAALHEARQLNKQLEARARETELENARYQERFRILEQWNRSQQQPQAPAEANFDEDFISAGKQTAEQVKGVEQKLKEFEAHQQRAQQQQYVYQTYAQDADRVRATTPDFNEGYKFLIDGRKAEIAAIGLTGQEAAQALKNDEESIVLLALQNRRSPAETMYALAKARGYQPKAQSNAAGEKLDTIERGQLANKSLSSAGGEGGAENMTAERALKMDNDDFLAWTKKHPAQARKLFGG